MIDQFFFLEKEVRFKNYIYVSSSSLFSYVCTTQNQYKLNAAKFGFFPLLKAKTIYGTCDLISPNPLKAQLRFHYRLIELVIPIFVLLLRLQSLRNKPRTLNLIRCIEDDDDDLLSRDCI